VRPAITIAQTQVQPSIQIAAPFDSAPKGTILINEETILKGLNMQNPGTLIAELEKNGYISNGEPTDDFAKLSGPDANFNLSDAFGAQKDKIFYFLQGIYINNAIAKGEKETEEKRVAFQGTLDSVWRRALLFRDSALKRYFDLAECYYQIGNYDKAIETARNIIDSNYNTNSRKPLFYNEAIFLSANSLYRKGMAQYNNADTEQEMADAKQYLREAIKLIHTKYSGLRESDSYRSEYCSQLLEMSSSYFELTKEDPYYVGDDGKTVNIGIEEISNIYEASVESNASWDSGKPIGWLMDKTGHFGGTFMKYFDYFTAAKTRVNYARYCMAYRKKHEGNIPETVADPATVLEETFGIANDVASASRPSKGRLLYFHKGVIDAAVDLWQKKGHEFVNAFGLYTAQAHRIKALSYYAHDDGANALTEIQKAFQEISDRKEEAGSSFYVGGWEIKKSYFDIVSDYLDILLSSKDKNGNSIQENTREAAQISKGLLADTTFATIIERENPRLYAKIKITAENYMPSKTDEVISTEPDPLEGLGPWDFHDFALSNAFGLRKIWSERRTAGLWSETTTNLLNVIENPNKKYVSDADRPLLLARSYTWLGNLMKWAEEGETDPAVEQQIIELAKGLAKTEEDKAVAGTREGAIIALYKAALEQFQSITGKELYLEAEEASTRYQLANLAQGILEDTKIEDSDPLRTAAQKITDKTGYNNDIETAKTVLAEIIKKASAPENAYIRDNAITDYASCLAEKINSLLSSAEAGSAYDEAKNQFEVLVESGEKLPASEELIKYCENSGCKYYYDEENKALVVRGKMTPDEKIELKKLLTSETAKQAIEVLFNNSQNPLCVNIGKWTVPSTEGAIPPMLTVANALISKPFGENDNNGPITRIKVSEIADLAEAKIISKYSDLAAAPKEVKAQLADIAALRLYVLMGNTPAGEAIPDDKIASYIKTTNKEDGSTAIVIPLKTGKEVEVADVFMQQKLKLALISIWLRNKAWTEETLKLAKDWTADIKNNGLNYTFRTYAIQNGVSLVGIEVNTAR